MRSIGEPSVRLTASAYRSLRFLPAQNSRSNSSFDVRDALQAEQLAEDHGPARERGDHQPGHHELDDEARLQ